MSCIYFHGNYIIHFNTYVEVFDIKNTHKNTHEKNMKPCNKTANKNKTLKIFKTFAPFKLKRHLIIIGIDHNHTYT